MIALAPIWARPAARAFPACSLAGRRAAVIALSHYPWDPRIRRETEALVEAGMTVDLFCLQETPDQPRRETVNGVRVNRLALRRARTGCLRYLLEYGLFFGWGFWRLTAASLRRRYALVHVHNLPDLLVFTTLVPRLRGARIILDLHDPMPELFRTIFGLGARHPVVGLLTLSERWATGYADLVLTPNQAFRNLFVSRLPCPAKFKVVMNTPADDIFHPQAGGPAAAPAAGAPRAFRLMYHGLIAERHGLDLLVEAVKLLAPEIPELTLDIYGGASPFLSGVEDQVRRCGLGDRVQYHGKKSLPEIAAIIRTIDLGVIPNRRGPFTELNFPTRIFEYLALHKPVMTLDTRGVRDYFDADELFLVRSDEPAALADTIRRVHADPALVRQTVERGYAVYRRHRWSDEKPRFVGHVSRLVIPDPDRSG